MEKLGVKALKREGVGKEVVKKMRKVGFIPGIIYGKDINVLIKIPIPELKVLKEHHFSEGNLVEITLKDSEDKNDIIPTIIKDVQIHALTEKVLHIDFLKVSMEERIKVSIAVVLKGEARGLKEGGVLGQILWELEIEALPLDIPERIEIDISSLDVGHSIHVGDVNLGDKIKIIENPEETIVILTAKKEEAVEEVEEGPAPEEPAVIKMKKPDEEKS